MSYILVDIEADGPIPGDYSMISIGAVIVDDQLNRTFYGELKPISHVWIPEALAVSGFSRKKTMSFEDPYRVMNNFKTWIQSNSKGKPIFISDNNGFDWMFVCWYFHHFLQENPFGYSSRRLADLFCGVQKDVHAKWKHLRKTKHTHNPVDDATGNAEILLMLRDEYGLNIRLT
jgi:hypothetical protein